MPNPPTNVAVNVHNGSASTLDVSYGPPTSDGGSPVLSYRVEVDTSNFFTNPIATVFPCPVASEHSVFKVETAGYLQDPIVNGTFALSLAFNGATYTTAKIPYDAAAMAVDELGVSTLLVSSINATLPTATTPPSPFVVTVYGSADPTQFLFAGDRVQFGRAAVGDVQLYPGQIFEVTAVTTTTFTLKTPVTLSTSELAGTFGGRSVTPGVNVPIYRLTGGRGYAYSSRVACTADTSQVICPATSPADRVAFSGSLQSKLQNIPNALTAGVSVARSGPDAYGGYTWLVTFLDEALPGTTNFALSVATNGVLTSKNKAANITIAKQMDGIVNPPCTGRLQVPTDKALAIGQYYWARVFAVNEVGYSLPQISASSQKPMVVPGRPTAVTLTVFSATELRITFNPPSSDGGDTITSYMLEYATKSDFSNAAVAYVTYLAGGSPFFKTISGLTNGVFYYVRVRACNSQGCGKATATTPSRLNPYQQSDAPASVLLRATSNTMLTVEWTPPLDNGGDVITAYRVEWDVSLTFSSNLVNSPNKGYIELPASADQSWTLQYLTRGQVYYVRVFARNGAGLSPAQSASPFAVAPTLEVPGRPHSIQAQEGDYSGQIVVSWQRPRIPWHNIPCSGLLSSPMDCPVPIGGTLPASDGGTPITAYVVSYNEKDDFSGLDSGEITVSATQLSYTLNALTPGRNYFIRVLARNAHGSGQFCVYSDANCIVGQAATRVQQVAAM